MASSSSSKINDSKVPSQTLWQASQPPSEDLDPSDAVSWFAYTAAVALASLAIPLITFPRLIMFLMGGLDEESTQMGKIGRTQREIFSSGRIGLTRLERFLCLQMGVLLIALACLILCMTAPPAPHLDPVQPEAPSSTATTGHSKRSRFKQTPQRVQTIWILTPLFFISAGTSYNTALSGLSLYVTFVTGVIGVYGAWVCMFFEEPSHLSKTTKADKRTSSFPFKNKASAREIKKAFISSNLNQDQSGSKSGLSTIGIEIGSTSGTNSRRTDEFELKERR
ncbi:hypothetical protein [Phaffia rhodozyma]|uniref:Uncharacterized protein n=1 Tax=Phaffia rhodozyma TaxID=264483 RepID=A0A0F7SVV4_PHARH|nr:hypothetical protein [Phaffia rhodozyma]